MGREGRPHLEDRREVLRWDWDEMATGGGRWGIFAKEHLLRSLMNYLLYNALRCSDAKINPACWEAPPQCVLPEI